MRLHLSKNLQRGFTLIELLVVIAIIGILASVVLASLNTARGKGANAAIKSNLHNMRTQAELVYDSVSPNSYATVCANPNISKGVTAAATAANATVGATNALVDTTHASCFNAANTWVIEVPLKVAEGANIYWCVDNSGTSKGTANAALANATVCP